MEKYNPEFVRYTFKINRWGTLGFEKRINDTIKILSGIPNPDLITIAGSQGNLKTLAMSLLLCLMR